MRPETIGDLTTTPPDRWNISCPEYSSLALRYHHSRQTGGPGSTISCTLTVKSLPGSHTRLPSISKGMQRRLHRLLTSSITGLYCGDLSVLRFLVLFCV